MLRPRIIPCLLIQGGGLVKTVQFSNPKYVGDPINAVRIFNEKEVDELIVIDVDATVKDREPDYNLIAKLAAECRMPLCYGGGIKSLDQVETIIGLGVEKVALSSAVIKNPALIADASARVGRQSIVVVMDIKKVGLLQNYRIFTHNGQKPTGLSPFDFSLKAEEMGAGEILFNFIDKDGMMNGYDIIFAKKMKEVLSTPYTIVGGAGDVADIHDLFRNCGLIGAAAGSIFVFKGKYRAVLIRYPNINERNILTELAVSCEMN